MFVQLTSKDLQCRTTCGRHLCWVLNEACQWLGCFQSRELTWWHLSFPSPSWRTISSYFIIFMALANPWPLDFRDSSDSSSQKVGGPLPPLGLVLTDVANSGLGRNANPWHSGGWCLSLCECARPVKVHRNQGSGVVLGWGGVDVHWNLHLSRSALSSFEFWLPEIKEFYSAPLRETWPCSAVLILDRLYMFYMFLA